ncbi:asparagine synthase-related protein [Streptomyces sp. NPDC017941]|uniref:asparagine synthase-related protein n=1 Tax=Streptomyces sp. NPDC017941 TaxID=3365018 RepID=UPI0037B19171
MLRFHVRRDDLKRLWQPTPDGWSAGRSRLNPLRHPALEEVASRGPGRFLLTVRERCAGTPPDLPSRGVGVAVSVPEWDRALAAALAWPLQSMTVVVRAGDDGGSPGALDVHCGLWGTGSLYAAAEGEELHADWDPSRLYHLLARDCLDPLRAAAFLAWSETPYSRRTLLRDLWLLTAGSRGTWPTGGNPAQPLSVTYPPPVNLPRTGRTAPGADVPHAFWRALGASMRRWVGSGGAADGAPTAYELSGGLDSSLVAACAATLTGRPPRTYGLTMPGEQRAGQRVRRAELIDRFGAVDTTRALAADPLLSPGGARAHARGVVPWEECYHESVGALFRTAAADGVRSLFTGFGGDELCAPHPHDKLTGPGDGPTGNGPTGNGPTGNGPTGNGPTGIGPAGNGPMSTSPGPDPVPGHLSRTAKELLHDTTADQESAFDLAPRGHVADSAIESVTSGSALYLRHGIWPIHPLCTPELARLCRRLPGEWRSGRTVQRELLTAIGLPAIGRPGGTDDFSPAMVTALRGPARPLLTDLFTAPLLADTRLIDQRVLLSRYLAWADGGPGHEMEFYSAAILELTLRSVEASRREHAL